MTSNRSRRDEAADYLISYAEDDWVMLSVVVSEARGVAGAGATTSEIAAVTLDLSETLIANGSPPGDLVAGEPGFVAWSGDSAAQLERLRTELEAMVGQHRLPLADDICWFHTVRR